MASSKKEASKQEPEAPKQESRLTIVKRAIGSEQIRKAVEAVLPRGIGIDAEKFVQMASSYVTVDALLPDSGNFHRARIIECDLETIVRCVAQTAELGLVPGGALQHCWWLPRAKVCTLTVGVWGYVELARRSGEIRDVYAEVIYEADRLEVRMGTDRALLHEPAWTLEPGKPVAEGGRGQAMGAYAVAVYADGTRSWELMPERDLAKARAAAGKASDSPAYKTWPDEMRKKSVIKRARKKWFLSIESAAAIAKAMAFEDEADERAIEVRGEEVRVPPQHPHPALEPATPSAKEVLDAMTEELRERETVETRSEPQEEPEPAMREPGEEG